LKNERLKNYIYNDLKIIYEWKMIFKELLQKV
jgi:hypothetical protein